jgi:hypothetical protein
MTRLILAHPFTDELRRNLAPNPKAVTLTGYTTITSAGSGHTVASAAVSGAPVATAARLTVGTNIATGYYGVRYTGTPVVAGETYTISAYGRQNVGTRQAEIRVLWRDASNAAISETGGGSLASSSNNVWFRRSLTAVAPAGAVTAWVDIRVIDAVSVGGNVWATAFLVEAGSSLGDYFDGDTPDTLVPPVDYAWEGASDASASTASAPTSSEQIQPALVLAPWAAGRQSRSILHEYMDDPGSTRLTWVSPSPRTGEFDMLFATPAEAASAFDTFGTHQWFSYDGGGDATQAVDAFCVTPGGQPAYGHVASLARGEGTIAPVQRWHVLVPWTELS